MKNVNRLIAVLLSVLLMFGIVGCSKESADPNTISLGDYEVKFKSACIMKNIYGEDAVVITLDFTNNSESANSYAYCVSETVEQGGEELSFTSVLLDESTYETTSDAQFTEVEPGQTLELKTAFTLNDTETNVEATFSQFFGGKNGTVTIEIAGLEKVEAANNTTDGAEGNDTYVIPGTDTTEATTGDPLLDWWNGEWYGWWVMTSCSGYYEGMDNYWWDICATIDIGEDYQGTITLWDNDYTKETAMSEATVSLSSAGTGEHGTVMSEGGWFTNVALEHADWIVDPGLVNYDNIVCIDGWYEDGSDTYKYNIYLRPWGMIWDDMTEDDLPPNYSNWYLPLVESGASMPENWEGLSDSQGTETTSEPSEASTPTAEPAAPVATGKMLDKSMNMTTFFGNFPTVIKFAIPEGTWCMADTSFDYKFKIINYPTDSGSPFQTPYIVFTLYDSMEKLDFYKNDFENLQQLSDRVIGGITMAGRTYKNVGIQWEEYYADLPNGGSLSILIAYTNTTESADCNTILDSISFD